MIMVMLPIIVLRMLHVSCLVSHRPSLSVHACPCCRLNAAVVLVIMLAHPW